MTGTRVYPWAALHAPGDVFIWLDRRDERSLRAQASKQAKRRSIRITVELIAEGLRVTYVCGIL